MPPQVSTTMPIEQKEGYGGSYDITGFGFSGEVLVNDVFQSKIVGSSFGTIKGQRLKKGKNTIIINVKKDAKAFPTDELVVKITAFINEKDVEVFSYTNKNPPEVIKQEFTVQE